MKLTLPASDQDQRGLLVITGASGWVGQTAVHELQKKLSAPIFFRYVRLFGSRSGSLHASNRIRIEQPEIPIYPLSSLAELASSEPIRAVLHTAFLTRDRISESGHSKNVSTNRWITHQIVEALRRSPNTKTVLISPGDAVQHEHNLTSDQQLSQDPYGVLNREEDRLVSSVAPSLVLRLYALSGFFMRDPKRFALGDFLLKALSGMAIHVRSSKPVLRSYGHASNVTRLAWRWLFNDCAPPPALLAAVSLGIDLLSLAKRISLLYELPTPCAEIDPLAPPDSYTDDPEPFLKALCHYSLKATDLNRQIRDIAAGMIAQGVVRMRP